MRAGILALADGEIADPAVTSRLEPNTYPAVDATEYTDLEGASIYAGTAAAEVDQETERVYVTEDSITTEPDQRSEAVACEFTADLEAGWVAIDRSDGEWLFDALGSAKGARFHPAVIDVDAFAEYLGDYPSAEAWNVTQTRSLDADGVAEEATINYHDAARLADTGGSRETSMLGFRARLDGRHTRGVIAESGWVAVFDGPTAPSAFATFVNSEVLPFAELPEEFQRQLVDHGRDTTDQEVSADGAE